MTEWKAEMPYSFKNHPWSTDGYRVLVDVEALVTRANEELAKVRAERDEARAELDEAVIAFKDSTRMRSLIQEARVKAETERDAALARVRELEDSLRGFEATMAPENGLGESLAGCALRVVQELNHYRLRCEELGNNRSEVSRLLALAIGQRDAALSRVRELTEWRPMSQAPKDVWVTVCEIGFSQAYRAIYDSLASAWFDGDGNRRLPNLWLFFPEPLKEDA